MKTFQTRRGTVNVGRANDNILVWVAYDNSGAFVASGHEGCEAMARTEGYIALCRAGCAPF